MADRPIITHLEAAVHRVLDHLGALTGVLDRLERKRLVRRRVNAADRRSFTIELTAAGEAAAARVHEAFADLDARVRGDVPSAATDGFHHVLDTLERHIRGTKP